MSKGRRNDSVRRTRKAAMQLPQDQGTAGKGIQGFNQPPKPDRGPDTGHQKMVEKDTYCPDILIQVAAANAALNSFNKVLLAEHIKTCVTNDIREGKEETVDELLETLKKLMK